ncbi:Cleavage stimulation factor subunit 1 [Exaiptasia diaphana]|nr:Cleavage stimulation factor subunit 1 [Exaiptasia diaphana]
MPQTHDQGQGMNLENHPVIRTLYDHQEVKYAPTGNLYASSSVDGSIKVWDGVSNKCVATFPQAHKGAEVYTVQFSHNSKYLISCGKDNIVFLWELSTGKTTCVE